MEDYSGRMETTIRGLLINPRQITRVKEIAEDEE